MLNSYIDRVTPRTHTMASTSARIFLGAVAGALAMLLCHQPTLQTFYWLGLAPQAAFRLAHVPPFNVPMVVSMTFWGAIYGGLFGLASPRAPRLFVARAVLAGVFAMLMAWFVVRPLAGNSIAFGWEHTALLRSAAANLAWGFGAAAMMPILRPRCLLTRSREWAAQRHLAA